MLTRRYGPDVVGGAEFGTKDPEVVFEELLDGEELDLRRVIHVDDDESRIKYRDNGYVIDAFDNYVADDDELPVLQTELTLILEEVFEASLGG